MTNDLFGFFWQLRDKKETFVHKFSSGPRPAVCAAWTYSVFSWASRAGAASQAGGNVGDGVLSAYGVPVARWTETVRVAAGEDGVFVVRYRFHAGRRRELI